MSKRGDSFNNPITGDHGVIRLGTEDTPDKRVVSDLWIRPTVSGIGEHIHPSIEERITIVSGKIAYRLDGQEGMATGGDVIEFEQGKTHDWWNAGDQEARVIIEIIPAVRFELMVSTLFGLVQDGKTNKNGSPNLLQMAVIAQEFSDTVQYTGSAIIQTVLFNIIAPIGRMRGYQATYEHYMNADVDSVELAPLPEHLQYLDKA